jgi:UDP-N-acetylglucosamine--N-acetylmuramyl-(pentapeptide) pyrophosphoryl-undecaprenol N-acetylglucosamine transferase
MKVILAGGGTGGHVIPAIAIADELRDRHGAEVLFVGTSRGIENRLVPAAGYALKLIEVGALNRVSLATRAKTLFALPAAVLHGRKLLKDFQPDVVIGVGGYASGPVMLAATFGPYSTLLFEPNAIPGFANRILARRVHAAAVHLQETCRFFPRCEVTGVPVRAEFFQIQTKRERQPTLLLFGGSQGARALNRALTAAAPELLRRIPDLHIVHQTGQSDFDQCRSEYDHAAIPAEVLPFIDGMAGAFARADLLLCRSGASTVAEVASAGKPAIFVPLPTAADDHQTRNAETFARHNAGVLLPQQDLTPERLTETVAGLLDNRERLLHMGEAARQLAHPDAARKIAELAITLSRKTGRR